jgi:hypothetical protein
MEAYCSNKRCKKKPELMEVSNGFISRALFCPDCKSVYVLKLERVEKVSKEFLEQCLDQLEHENRKKILIAELVIEKQQKVEKERERQEEEQRKKREEEEQKKKNVKK